MTTNGTTTIRIHSQTKKKLEKLDFVKKHSYNDILLELMDFYNKNKIKKRGK